MVSRRGTARREKRCESGERARESEKREFAAMAQQQHQQQADVPSRPSSPPVSISPPPGQPSVVGASPLQTLQQQAQAAPTGMGKREARRASTACDGDQTAAATAVGRAGTRKVSGGKGTPSGGVGGTRSLKAVVVVRFCCVSFVSFLCASLLFFACRVSCVFFWPGAGPPCLKKKIKPRLVLRCCRITKKPKVCLCVCVCEYPLPPPVSSASPSVLASTHTPRVDRWPSGLYLCCVPIQLRIPAGRCFARAHRTPGGVAHDARLRCRLTPSNIFHLWGS